MFDSHVHFDHNINIAPGSADVDALPWINVRGQFAWVQGWVVENRGPLAGGHRKMDFGTSYPPHSLSFDCRL